MKRDVTITNDPIDEPALLQSRETSGDGGAAIYFSGIVREREGDASLEAIHYETFLAMAERQFNLILDQVQARWPILSVRVVHRIGPVDVGDPSLWVEMIAPHRGEAFEACQFLIDEMKRVVPIWKHPIVKR